MQGGRILHGLIVKKFIGSVVGDILLIVHRLLAVGSAERKSSNVLRCSEFSCNWHRETLLFHKIKVLLVVLDNQQVLVYFRVAGIEVSREDTFEWTRVGDIAGLDRLIGVCLGLR